jgi:hypothetical protein
VSLIIGKQDDYFDGVAFAILNPNLQCSCAGALKVADKFT